jgi:hypothetical protein
MFVMGVSTVVLFCVVFNPTYLNGRISRPTYEPREPEELPSVPEPPMATNVPDFGTAPEMEPEELVFFDDANAAADAKTEDAATTAEKEARKIIGLSPF